MKIGVRSPQAASDGAETWPEISALARQAEEGGVDSLWLIDHFFYREDDAAVGTETGFHEPWTLLSALAAVTSRVELGTLVLSTSFRPAGLLAKLAATADAISGGRVILGLRRGTTANLHTRLHSRTCRQSRGTDQDLAQPRPLTGWGPCVKPVAGKLPAATAHQQGADRVPVPAGGRAKAGSMPARMGPPFGRLTRPPTRLLGATQPLPKVASLRLLRQVRRHRPVTPPDNVDASSPRLRARAAPGEGASMWARRLLPALLIVVWLVGASVGGPYFGKVDEVSSNDPTSYLPESADATRVQRALGDFDDSRTIPAIVVFASEVRLSEAQLTSISTQVASLAGTRGVGSAISPALPSQDGLAVQAFVPIEVDSDVAEVVSVIGAALEASVPPGVSVHVTGPAGFTAELVGAFAGIDGILLAVALLAVLIILILVYRSVLLPVAVLATSLSALCLALLSVWWLANAGILLLSGQTQGILFILVIGAATDYSLLYVSRYREELRVNTDPWVASARAIRGSFEPIVASGGTVIAGLLCLLLSDLKSNSTLGPVAAVGIVFAMLAALTLLPALLFLLGRTAFWPRRPTYEPDVVARAGGMPTRGTWVRLSEQIERRPRMIWIVTSIALAAGTLGLTQLDAVGVPQSDLVLGRSEARAGQAVLGAHFPAGSGRPVLVVVDESALQAAADIMLAEEGIEAVRVRSAESPSGSASVTAEGIVGFGPPGTPAPQPTVAGGNVLLQGTLRDAADSAAAATTVRELRAQLAAVPSAVVGGATATAVDTNEASIRDRSLIIPAVLGVILVILMLLLRSVIAPVVLVLTTVLSFGATLGISALVFNGILGFPGADASVPLFGFIFLVALGIDYNIFLMTRVREESIRHGTHEGIVRGLVITGGVITSAGLVLAATFAALSVIPILFLVQIAFIVAVGVLLDTFVVRSLLVPALAYDIGRRIWWPSSVSREPDGDPGQKAGTDEERRRLR